MIPHVLPEVIAGRIQRKLRPPYFGPHIGVLGHTRSGKDYAARHLILLARPRSAVIVLDVKASHHSSICGRAGCAGAGDATWCGWGRDYLPGDDLGELFRPSREHAHRVRVMVPAVGGRELVEPVLNRLGAVGECGVIMSDTGHITEPSNRGGLGLGGLVTRRMSEGASAGLWFVPCSTSAAYAESGVKDQVSATLIGQTSSHKMRATFAELAGLPKHGRAALDVLKPREFLYVDHADGDPALAITSARLTGRTA
jgi:hypothetical protein